MRYFIDLQRKARPMHGRIEHYWFENQHVGLAWTLFHRIVLPFAPFDSGLDYVAQPESTELIVEWINLGLDDPARLDGTVITMGETSGVEASIYLGGAHNWTDIKELKLTEEEGVYLVQCRAIVEFENEGVAENEPFEFRATATYQGDAD